MVFEHNKIIECPENEKNVFFLKHESQSFILIQLKKMIYGNGKSQIKNKIM